MKGCHRKILFFTRACKDVNQNNRDSPDPKVEVSELEFGFFA